MPDRLRDILSEKGLGDLFEMLDAEGIEAMMLADLTDDDLREIGLNLGQRKRFRAVYGKPGTPDKAALLPAERRQLTVVFCDLVGSTALATMLDPEDLRDVISDYLDTAVATAKAHGGHLAYTQGDGLMIYFGYPKAEEDDPIRAIRAALAIVTAVQNLRTIAPKPLDVRLGVATGRVVVGDMATASAASKDFVVGETPNLAARMQTVASPGEVIVAASTRSLVGGAFAFEERGTAMVKGFDKPQACFAAIAETTVATRFDTRSTGGVQPFVGRQEELAQLSALWRQVGGGTGRICRIDGAPGMGKSRLVRAFYARSGGAAIEWQCAPHLSNRALHPMSAELERASGIQRSDGSETRRAKLAAWLADAKGTEPDDLHLFASLVGATLPDDPTLDAQTRSKLTFDALLRRIRGLSKDDPVLIVLEDAHWADPLTVGFLDLLSRRIGDLSVLLVITCRQEFLEQEAAGFECEAISLRPLDAEDGLSLVKNIGSRREVPAALARLIIEKTDGVPLFVEELTKALLDAAPPDKPLTSAFIGEVDIPATLQDSLMARLDRLGPAKEIAQLGAVIGREFTAAMLRAIAPPGTDIETHLLRLQHTELVHRNGLMGPEYFVFNHALVQDTAYESILKSGRQAIHLKIARAMLERQPAFEASEPEIIARHAELGGLEREAMEHWTMAGHQALGRAANPAAVSHFNAALRCLAHLPKDEVRDATELKIQMSLAPACMATFGWAAEEVETACLRATDLAKRLASHEALYGATWGLWTNYFLRGEMDEALATADLVREMASQSESDILLPTADHARGFSHYFRGDFPACLDHAEAGIARFDLENEKRIVGMFQLSSTVTLHSFAAAAHWMHGENARSEAALHEALSLAETLDHAPSMAFCLAFTQYTLMYRKDWAGVQRTAKRLAHLAEEEGFLMWGPQTEVFLGLCDCESGALQAGLERVRRAFDRYAATGTTLTLMQLVPSIAEALIRNGETEEAIERLKTMIADAERRAERAYLPELYRVLSEAHFRTGSRHQGQASLKAARKLAERQGSVPLLARIDETARRIDMPQMVT